MSCAVFAAVSLDADPPTAATLGRTFRFCAERGRDSWGLEVLGHGGDLRRLSSVGGRPAPEEVPLDGPSTVIGNRRAEPTTEWVPDKREADIQPFQSERWLYTHNGTISNDGHLRRTYGLTTPTPIDTAVIGPLLDLVGFPATVRLLEGSFALLAVDRARPDRVHFACNYKPLWFLGSRSGRLLQFASQERFLEPTGFDPLHSPAPRQVPPYSIGTAGLDGISWTSLYPAPPPRRRVLVVCSGGLDSATVAWKHHRDGDEVSLFHLRYGARAEEPEVRAVAELGRRMGLPADRVLCIATDFFRSQARSVLTDPDAEITTARGGEAGAEFGHEWVPARNTVMLALAMAYAEAHGFDTIALGNNLEESGGGYPDNEEEFINKVQQLAPYALRPYHQVTVSQPVATLMKHEIVRLGLSLEMPFEVTWSCYQGGERHCGECGPCFMRRRAFEMNGAVDPVFAPAVGVG